MSPSLHTKDREFEAIFADLRALLEKFADRESLVVIDDSERRYCLAGGRHPNHKTRTLAIGPDQRLYVSIGSFCDACAETDPMRASIWRS